MRISRRAFLRLAAGSLGFGSIGAASGAAPPGALDVHAATRNTRLATLGEAARRLLGAAPGRPPAAAGPRRQLPLPERASGRPLAATIRGYAPTPGFAGDPLPLAELARLLFLANGPTGRLARAPRRHAHRAAPSAGALYAGELYVVAERIAGLEPGVYRYAAPQHALLPLRTGAMFDRIADAADPPDAVHGAAAAVLLTNVFARYARRYGSRAYRYALLDTGHIGENLRLAAAASGLGEATWLRFEDDALNALLGVDGRSEAVCALHAVGRRTAEAPPQRARRLVERGRASDSDAPLTQRYHEATALVPGRPQRATPSGAVPDPDGGAGEPLPTLESPDRSVQTTIVRRCSAGRFAGRALERAELGFVLEMATAHAPLARVPDVGLLVAVHRVEGIEAGLYRVLPRARRLASVRPGDLRAPLVDACLGQGLAGQAAAVCFGVARIGAATARAGQRSYRDLLIEAGAIAERIYLGANAARLRARNLAAFWDDDLNALLGLDGRRDAVVHVTLVGP